MRTVFDNSMTAHVWAQNNQHEGRSHNGNFYFEGGTLYSYGSHFIVGHIVDGVTLLNSDRYSISTGKQQGYAQSAAHGVVYNVPALTSLVKNGLNSKSNINSYLCNHADEISRDAVIWLLGRIKSRRDVDGTIENAKRIKLANEAKEVRDEINRRAREAKWIADYSDADFAARLREWADHWSGEDKFKSESRNYFRAIKAAKHKGWSAIAAKVTARRKELRAYMEVAANIRKHNEDRKNARRIIGAMRREFKYFASGKTTSFREVEQLAKQCINLAHMKAFYVPSRLRKSLLTFARQLDATLPAIAEIERVKREAIAAEKRAKAKADFEGWLRGDVARCPWDHNTAPDGSCYMRVKDGELQTSQNAVVPLRHAIRAFKMVRYCVENGVDWHRNGQTIRAGHFQIDSITKEGAMKAGCHTFSYEQMQAVAKRHDLFDTATPENVAAQPVSEGV